MFSPQDIEDYLPINDLVDRGIYIIVGRNSYIGIWLASESAFMISRYKCGPDPYIHYEYHWDVGPAETGNPAGTAKPLRFIEICKFEIDGNLTKRQQKAVTAYLDKTEINNPVSSGFCSLKERKMAAMEFYNRLKGKNS